VWGEVYTVGAVEELPPHGDGEVGEHGQTGEVDLDTKHNTNTELQTTAFVWTPTNINTHTYTHHTQPSTPFGHCGVCVGLVTGLSSLTWVWGWVRLHRLNQPSPHTLKRALACYYCSTCSVHNPMQSLQ